MLICPKCNNSLNENIFQYSCQKCGKIFYEKDGIIQFTEDTQIGEQYFPDNAFEILFQSEEKNFWFRVRNKIIGSTIAQYLIPKSRILEVGCGTGFVSQYLKKRGYSVECADLFFDGLYFCKMRAAGDKYYQFNLLERLFIEEFEGICAFDVLEHIDNDSAVLKNLCEALLPGGYLFVTVPADKRLWSDMDIHAEHKRRYSAQDLRVKIEKNGFKVVKLSYFMTFLYPFILLSRKMSVMIGMKNEEDTEQKFKRKLMIELQPNRIINSIFYLIFSLEVPILQVCNMPFGSSLLCVAIKQDLPKDP